MSQTPSRQSDGDERLPWEGLSAREAFFAGARFIVPTVASLAPIYQEQDNLREAIEQAGLGTVDVYENAVKARGDADVA